MPIHVQFNLTVDQRVDAILYEVKSKPDFDFTTLKTQTAIRSLVVSHLINHGLSLLNKPLPASLCIRRQDVIGALKGLLTFR
jgi:hypothetical protein